jgi:energy-converting hydrogenase Eha subunit A
MLDGVPAELSIRGVLVSPVLVAVVLGFVAAAVGARYLNRARLGRFVWNPPVVFLCVWFVLSAVANALIVSL